ncbi:Uncharacterised protein [Salmonella enterica subsp. houtenae]|nr:Uncharacterised protein [Salmonella enterica subsp. houtenae]
MRSPSWRCICLCVFHSPDHDDIKTPLDTRCFIVRRIPRSALTAQVSSIIIDEDYEDSSSTSV